MANRPAVPPLPALRAFAAAARRGAFRDAAADLGVTPSAVSHQVRALEAWLGAPLFVRDVRQVRLTPAGDRLGAALNAAFDDIDRAVAAVRADAAAPRTLRIATLPLFANVWLAPRLERFEAAHPDLSLAIDTDARIVDLDRREADIAIRNVHAPTPGVAVRKLLDLRGTPLCAPAVAARLHAPADLARETWIALSVGRAGWPDWLAAAGVAGLAPKRTLTFDNLPSALEAAANGRGVILGLLPLVWDAPAAASLVAPFAIAPVEAGAYYLAFRKADRADAAVRAFADWVSAEMRADKRRLVALQAQRLARA